MPVGGWGNSLGARKGWETRRRGWLFTDVDPVEAAKNAKTGQPFAVTLFRGMLPAGKKVYDRIPSQFAVGTHWTPHRDLAETYGTRIVERTIILNNPYVWRMPNKHDYMREMDDEFGTHDPIAVTRRLRARGYDGLIVQNVPIHRPKYSYQKEEKRSKPVWIPDSTEIIIFDRPLPDTEPGESIAKYRPDQPRVPRGEPGAGQWTKDETPAERKLRQQQEETAWLKEHRPQLYAAAERHQKRAAKYLPVLEKLLAEVAAENNAIEFMANLKTARSLAMKVVRHPHDPHYTISSPKDHVRGAIIIRDWSQVPEIVRSLRARREFAGEAGITHKPHNRYGFRALFLSTELAPGIKGEIQIHTPESWAIKKRTEEYYRQYRKYDGLTARQVPSGEWKRMKQAMRISSELWNDYWGKVPGAIKRAASSAVMGTESRHSPTSPSKGTHRPDALSKTSGGLSSSVAPESSTRPSAVTENLVYGSLLIQPSITEVRKIFNRPLRYGLGTRLFYLQFPSEIERALYVISGGTRGKNHKRLARWLADRFPDASESEIHQKAESVRRFVRRAAKIETGDTIIVPPLGNIAKPESAAEVIKTLVSEDNPDVAIGASPRNLRKMLDSMDEEQAVRFFLALPQPEAQAVCGERALNVKQHAVLCTTPASARKVYKSGPDFIHIGRADGRPEITKTFTKPVVLECVVTRGALGRPLSLKTVEPFGRFYTVQKVDNDDVLKIYQLGRNGSGWSLPLVTARPFSGPVMKSADISPQRLIADMAKRAFDESQVNRDARGRFARKGVSAIFGGSGRKIVGTAVQIGGRVYLGDAPDDVHIDILDKHGLPHAWAGRMGYLLDNGRFISRHEAVERFGDWESVALAERGAFIDPEDFDAYKREFADAGLVAKNLGIYFYDGRKDGRIAKDAEFEAKHPRHPAGAEGGKGGQFAPKQETVAGPMPPPPPLKSIRRYRMFILQAISGRNPDEYFKQHENEIMEVARALRARYGPHHPETVYRGVLLDPQTVKDGVLVHDPKLQYLSFSLDKSMALVFADPASPMSEFMRLKYPHYKGYLITTESQPEEVVLHPRWVKFLDLDSVFGKREADIYRHQQEVILHTARTFKVEPVETGSSDPKHPGISN